jgi:hypothetical protein
VVDIFDEVEEDLRAERSARLLKKYAWVLVAAALAVIGATIGWQLWTRWQANQDTVAAQQYITAESAAGKVPGAQAPADAIAALELQATAGPQGYKTLSRLRLADLKANSGDLEGAVALWDQVASDGNADKILRDLASLLAAQHQLDSGDPVVLEARLKPLAAPDNPWSALAREQIALLALRKGNTAEAKTTLKALSVDILAPTGVRQRAGALLAGLGGE